MKKKHIILLCIALFLLIGVIWLIWGNVTVGLITYLRTDSVRISEEADAAAREFVLNTYGEE